MLQLFPLRLWDLCHPVRRLNLWLLWHRLFLLIPWDQYHPVLLSSLWLQLFPLRP